MRLDKFLWTVRYYKTRTIATEECNKNRVRINNIVSKPSKEVMIGDELIIRKNQIDYSCTIIQIPPSRVGAKLVSLYIKDTTAKEQLDTLQLRNEVQGYYREQGTGRPTKKDRRDLDDYTEEEDSWF